MPCAVDCLSPPHPYVETWIPNEMISGGGPFGRYLGHEGGVLRNGISAFIGSWRDQSSPLPPHEVTEGRAAYEPGRVPQPDKQSASTLMRGYTASTTVRNTFLLFISPRLWYLVYLNRLKGLPIIIVIFKGEDMKLYQNLWWQRHPWWSSG